MLDLRASSCVSIVTTKRKRERERRKKKRSKCFFASFTICYGERHSPFHGTSGAGTVMHEWLLFHLSRGLTGVPSGENTFALSPIEYARWIKLHMHSVVCREERGGGGPAAAIVTVDELAEASIALRAELLLLRVEYSLRVCQLCSVFDSSRLTEEVKIYALLQCNDILRKRAQRKIFSLRGWYEWYYSINLSLSLSFTTFTWAFIYILIQREISRSMYSDTLSQIIHAFHRTNQSIILPEEEGQMRGRWAALKKVESLQLHHEMQFVHSRCSRCQIVDDALVWTVFFCHKIIRKCVITFSMLFCWEEAFFSLCVSVSLELRDVSEAVSIGWKVDGEWRWWHMLRRFRWRE